MAITIEESPGLATSNSYVSLADAETYIETRLHIADWTAATDENKKAGLVWATRLLDAQIEWLGYRIDDTQVLEWPRSGVTDRGGYFLSDSLIPTFLENATAEYALILLGADQSLDSALAGFERIKVDVIELVADDSTDKHTVPKSVEDMISYYGSLLSGSCLKPLVR